MNNKPEFHEDYQNPNESTLDPQTYDFNWEELYRNLGEGVETDEPLSRHDLAKLAGGLKVVLRWLTDIDLHRSGWETTLAHRVISLAWTLDPGYFEGSPSLTFLAEKIATHKATLSAHAADASRVFSIRNRGQAHGWNFKKDKGSPGCDMARPDSDPSQGKAASAKDTQSLLPLTR